MTEIYLYIIKKHYHNFSIKIIKIEEYEKEENKSIFHYE